MNKLILNGIFAILILFALNGCGDEPEITQENFYIKCNTRVVSMGEDEDKTSGKYPKPRTAYRVLLQNMQDTSMYMTYEITESRFYNTKIDDLFFWDYINKKRFFQITRK